MVVRLLRGTRRLSSRPGPARRSSDGLRQAIRRDEQLGDDRGVAVGKTCLATVRLFQRRYPEALAAYAEARERFTALIEPGSVAVIWHQTGMVYQEAGQPEAAEDAYRKSLAINVRLGNVRGQAGTLSQLGSLYDDDLGRPEEAWPFQPSSRRQRRRDRRRSERRGRHRSNVAIRLRKLRRLDEARQEIRRAIECAEFGHAAEPWKTWAILAEIETDTGNTAAAAEAKRKAIACYLAYRRDGGENHSDPNTPQPRCDPIPARWRPGSSRVPASGTRRPSRRGTASDFHPRPPSHRRRQPRPQPRRRPGVGLLDGGGNPLPDRNARSAPRAGVTQQSARAFRVHALAWGIGFTTLKRER